MGETPSLMGSLVYTGGAGFSEKSLGKCSHICLASVGNRMRLKRNGKGRSGYLHSTLSPHITWRNCYKHTREQYVLGTGENRRTLNRDGRDRSFLLMPEE